MGGNILVFKKLIETKGTLLLASMEIHPHFITASNWHNEIPSPFAREQLISLITLIVGYPCHITCFPYDTINKVSILVVRKSQQCVTDWIDIDIEGYLSVRRDQYPANRIKAIPVIQARVDAYNETLTVLQYSDSE